MISRVGVAVLFALLGLMSLWVWAAADSQICDHLVWLCVPPAGSCTEIDKCDVGMFRTAMFFAVILGPSIIFAISAFIFKKQPRRPSAWLMLTTTLFIGHGLVMAIIRTSSSFAAISTHLGWS